MKNLLPCPFCGGEAQVQHQSRKLYGDAVDWYGVYCNKQFCGYVSGQSTEAEAIAAWNTRAERTCRETTIDKFFNGCDSCGYVWQFFYSIGKCERPNYCPNCGAKIIGG